MYLIEKIEEFDQDRFRVYPMEKNRTLSGVGGLDLFVSSRDETSFGMTKEQFEESGKSFYQENHTFSELPEAIEYIYERMR